MKQNNFLKFILVGYIFAQIIEFQFNVFIANTYGNWIFTLFYYPAILAVFYFINQRVNQKIKNKKVADIFYYIVAATFGLFIMEWLIIGNSPWGNPEANQIGMLSFWVAVFFVPRIFISQSPEVEGIKKRITRYIMAYSLITFPLGFVLPETPRLIIIIWAEIIGYSLMHIFYWHYIFSNKPRTS